MEDMATIQCIGGFGRSPWPGWNGIDDQTSVVYRKLKLVMGKQYRSTRLEAQMYARILTTLVNPGSVDESLTLYKKSAVPRVEQQPGFRGLIGLVDRRTGKALSVTLWETAEDLQASNESSVLRDEEQRFASLLAAPPRREDYEVVANTMITHGPRMGWGNPFCRVTSASLHPEQWEDALALLTEQVIPAAKQERGFKGLISVADYSKGSSVTFSLWESIDDLEDSENSGYYQQQLARMARFMTELPTRETFELIVQAGQPDWVPWSAGN